VRFEILYLKNSGFKKLKLLLNILASFGYGLGIWRVWVRRGVCVGCGWGNRGGGGDHWGDLGVDGRIIQGGAK